MRPARCQQDWRMQKHREKKKKKKTAKIWSTKKQFGDFISLEVSCSKRVQYVDQIEGRSSGTFD